MMSTEVMVVFLMFSMSNVRVLENGLARTPPMGWMSWGYYMCADDCEKTPEKCLNEDLILSVADTFYEEGYQEAGYEYIIIDDCWSERRRYVNNSLVPDLKRFPNGMKYIADYIHKRGLKFGMYTNIADITCMHYPGSKDHFAIDAHTFAGWGVDYLKVDGCFVGEDYLDTAYIHFGRALNESGRPMVFSCSWPYYKEFIHKEKPNYAPIAENCNLWRNYHDVYTEWRSVKNIIQHYEKEYPYMVQYHKPGQWNDPDMLIFGTKTLTDGQSRVQLSVYAMLSAPLLLSCDVTFLTKYEKKLLQNMDLLAIAQDPAGTMAKPFKIQNDVTLWVKPHLPKKADIYPSFSFNLVNLGFEDVSISFTPGLYGLSSNDRYTILDIFENKYLRNITLQESLSVLVPFEAPGCSIPKRASKGFCTVRC